MLSTVTLGALTIVAGLGLGAPASPAADGPAVEPMGARAEGDTETSAPRSEAPAGPVTPPRGAGESTLEHHVAAGYPTCARSRWRCCSTQSPCTRSRPARWVLAAVGAAAWAGGTAYLLWVGDTVGAGDPGGLFAGAGATATLGALVGAAAGLMGGDAPGHPDRIRPAVAGVAGEFGGRAVTGERAPGAMSAQLAPTWYFDDRGSRLRLLGTFGGQLGATVDVVPDAAAGAFEPTFAHTSTRIGLAADLATALPYPVLRPDRSAHLGAAELRWKPEVQIRRERFSLAGGQTRDVERTMLLPLTVGMRWHLAPRQRFTVYGGPRFDFVAYAADDDPLARGPAQIGSFYGEAWFDLDIPFRSRLVSHPARADVNGQVSFGYVHSRFDGRGVNLGGAKGFLGPVHGAFRLRVRPLGRIWALQGGLTTWVGNGVGLGVEAGVVLPQLGEEKFR